MMAVESFRPRFLSSLILVALVQVVLLPSAFGQPNVPKSGTSGSSKQTTGKDAGLQEVIAEGAGASPGEALKDAFRNAVRQVVGTVVDAETLVSNDEIVDDKVLTYSDGFIKTYDKVPGSEKQAGGIHRVKIKAKVERRSVVAKLKAANVAVKEVDGKGLFAEAVTKLDAEQVSSELLAKALKGFPANVIKATVLGKPRLLDKDVSRATVEFDVDISADLERYEVLQKTLVEILRKVAVQKGAFSLQAKAASENHRHQMSAFARASGYSRIASAIRGGELVNSPFPMSFEPPVRVIYAKNEPYRFETAMANYGTATSARPLNPQTEMIVLLNTGRDKDDDRSNWEWFHILHTKAFRSMVAVSISLNDVDGRELAMERFALLEHPGLRLSGQMAVVSPYWLFMGEFFANGGGIIIQPLFRTMRTTQKLSLALDNLKLGTNISGTVENTDFKRN